MKNKYMKNKYKYASVPVGRLHRPLQKLTIAAASLRMTVLLVSLFLLIMQPLAVLACATCGCSELCPLCMVRETETDTRNGGGLSDSLWGTIILKMAYQRDEQIQKLARHLRGANALTSGAIYGAAAGTLGQNIVSLAVLNHQQGNDSYLPGSLGLGLSGLLNIALDGNMLINWHMSKKIKARQLVVKGKVETILNHLEYSDASCPDAQRDLAEIIGQRGAADCLKLWRLSHNQIASSGGQRTGMVDQPIRQSQPELSQVEIKSTPIKVVTSQNIN